MRTIPPCDGCKYHKTKHLPFLGDVYGCINKKVDALKYMRLSTNGGICTERPVT
jgi:hypothetical protein